MRGDTRRRVVVRGGGWCAVVRGDVWRQTRVKVTIKVSVKAKEATK